MQSLNSLYFPETVLPHHLRNTLLLLPDTLHFLQPVEGDGSTSTDLFMEKGICQAHTPSPLGKDKDRFLGLINEIQEQKSSNAEQFSNLTLAHLSEEIQRGDKNHRSIMTTLLGGNTPPESTPDEENNAEKLWQDRLVLALAEILDKEEAELAENFSNIDSNELDLFQALKGEIDAETETGEEDPFTELTRIRSKLSQQRPGTIKRRLQAWKSFYTSGKLAEDFWLWITSNEEAGELLISHYETVSTRVSVPLLRLNIPEQMLMRDQDALEATRHFHVGATKIRQQIKDLLSKIVKQSHLELVDPVALLPDAGVLARDWNDQTEYYFPESKFGRRSLDFQFLANFSLDQLIRKETATDGLCHSIVAICRE
jgi:hypothetical protein